MSEKASTRLPTKLINYNISKTRPVKKTGSSIIVTDFFELKKPSDMSRNHQQIGPETQTTGGVKQGSFGRKSSMRRNIQKFIEPSSDFEMEC